MARLFIIDKIGIRIGRRLRTPLRYRRAIITCIFKYLHAMRA